MPTARERWKQRLPAWTLRLGVLAGLIWMVADHLRARVRAARIQASLERQRQEGLRAHFSSTLSDVSFTVYSLLPTLFDQISAKLDVEHSFAQLRERSSVKGASITDSQQLSAVSDDTGSSAAHPSTTATSKSGSPDAKAQQQALPESWASEFANQGGTSGHSEALKHLRPDEGQGAASTDAESMAVSSPSQTLSLSIDSHSPPSGSSSHSPPLLQSPSVSPRSRYATLQTAHRDEPAQQVPGPSKAKLWNEVKAGAITRAVVAIHVVPLVVLHTTSQLCMMARKQYLRDQKRAAAESEQRETVAASKWYLPWNYFSLSGMGLADVEGTAQAGAEDDAAAQHDAQLDREFLCSSWWLLHIGWRMIEDKVHAVAQQECHDLKLKQSMSVDDWRALIKRIRARLAVALENGAEPSLLQDAIIPPLGTDRFQTLLAAYPEVASQCPLPAAPQDPALLALLTEMIAQFRAPDYPFVLARSMDLLEDDLCATLADEAYAGGGDAGQGTQTMRLAAALPSVASWSRDLGSGYPEKALDRLLASGDVAAYAALVYGDFSSGRIA